MSNEKSLQRSMKKNSIRKTSIFPLPNATKPRYQVSKKLEFNDLPDDVLLAIFHYLSPIDLLNIGTVCRRWLDHFI